MSRSFIVILLLSVVGEHCSFAADRVLSSSDVAQIKRICRRVVGYPVAKEDDLWSPLKPFLRNKSGLDHLVVICGSQHCSGSIRLRDDTRVWYQYVHVPPEHSKVGFGDLTPDIEYKGNNRFVGVALVRHGKVVYSHGDPPAKTLIDHADEIGDI